MYVFASVYIYRISSAKCTKFPFSSYKLNAKMELLAGWLTADSKIINNHIFVQNTTSVIFKNPIHIYFNANSAQQLHETVISQQNLENKHECAAADSRSCNERIVKLHYLLQAITSSSTYLFWLVRWFFFYFFFLYVFVFCTNKH